jgi:hypothetical protein
MCSALSPASLAGVTATINLHHFAPPFLRSGIVAAMYEQRANPNGYGAVLANNWMERLARAAAAAGSPVNSSAYA